MRKIIQIQIEPRQPDIVFRQIDGLILQHAHIFVGDCQHQSVKLIPKIRRVLLHFGLVIAQTIINPVLLAQRVHQLDPRCHILPDLRRDQVARHHDKIRIDLLHGADHLIIFIAVHFVVKVRYQHKPALPRQARERKLLPHCHKTISVYDPDCQKCCSHQYHDQKKRPQHTLHILCFLLF